MDPARDRRPEVWVNCAASADGRLAYAGGARARLSSPEDLVRVQRLRKESNGVLVGVGTVIQDDPSLRVHWDLLGEPPGREPTRIVLDSKGRTPPTARVLDPSAPTIVAVSERSTRRFPPHVRTLVAGRDRVELPSLLLQLRELEVRKLLVEGGSEVLAEFVRSGLFDRLTVYYAPLFIGGRSAPPIAAGPETPGPDAVAPLELASLDRLGEGYVATYRPPAPGG